MHTYAGTMHYVVGMHRIRVTEHYLRITCVCELVKYNKQRNSNWRQGFYLHAQIGMGVFAIIEVLRFVALCIY